MKRPASWLIGFLDMALLALTWIVAAGALLTLGGVVASMVSADFARQLAGGLAATEPNLPASAVGPASLMLVALIVMVTALLLQRLRAVVRTVRRGIPFDPANPARLRQIAALLAAQQAATLVVQLRAGGAEPDLTAWLAVLIVWVLAEVFREGERLRRDAELTV